MTDQMRASMMKLDDTELTLADPGEDIRGRTVVDEAGEEVGAVDDLMIDDQETKVRFMEVGAGGFLGLGEKTIMVPVDAITRIDEDHVHIDRTRQDIVGGPEYDPELAEDESYWTHAYGYYGFGPYWAAGYTYPPFPYYGAVPPVRERRQRGV